MLIPRIHLQDKLYIHCDYFTRLSVTFPIEARHSRPRLFRTAASHPSQRFVQAVAASSEGIWLKVWDDALERGPSGTYSTLALLRLLSLHAFSDRMCLVPDCSHITDEKDSLCTHFLDSHISLQMNIKQCVDTIMDCSEDILFSIGLTLYNIFREIWS